MEFPSSWRNIRCPFHLSNAPSVRCGSACSKTWRCAACDHIRSTIIFALCAASQGSSGGRPIPRRLRIFAGFKCTNARSGTAAHHQRLGLSAALLLQRNARPARSVAAPGPGALSTQIASGAERRGSWPAARSGTWAEGTGLLSALPMVPGCGYQRWRPSRSATSTARAC